MVCAGSAKALGGGSCIVAESVASARCQPVSGAAAVLCPRRWVCGIAARAALSWSTVVGKGGALASPASAAGSWSRTVVGGGALLVVSVAGGPAPVARGLEETWVDVCAAGYGVEREASCCIASRALDVVASGERAATGQGWKYGPASVICGRRGAPYLRGCSAPRVLGVGVWVPMLVARRHQWSSVCRRCLPRHAGHAPAGSRLPGRGNAASRSWRSSL